MTEMEDGFEKVEALKIKEMMLSFRLLGGAQSNREFHNRECKRKSF